jgi:hypothetical protein
MERLDRADWIEPKDATTRAMRDADFPIAKQPDVPNA